MRVVTLGSLNAIAPVAAPSPGTYGFGEATIVTAPVEEKSTMMYCGMTLAAGLGIGFVLGRISKR
jgi:hypothetical protein